MRRKTEFTPTCKRRTHAFGVWIDRQTRCPIPKNRDCTQATETLRNCDCGARFNGHFIKGCTTGTDRTHNLNEDGLTPKISNENFQAKDLCKLISCNGSNTLTKSTMSKEMNAAAGSPPTRESMNEYSRPDNNENEIPVGTEEFYTCDESLKIEGRLYRYVHGQCGLYINDTWKSLLFVGKAKIPFFCNEPHNDLALDLQATLAQDIKEDEEELDRERSKAEEDGAPIPDSMVSDKKEIYASSKAKRKRDFIITYGKPNYRENGIRVMVQLAQGLQMKSGFNPPEDIPDRQANFLFNVLDAYGRKAPWNPYSKQAIDLYVLMQIGVLPVEGDALVHMATAWKEVVRRATGDLQSRQMGEGFLPPLLLLANAFIKAFCKFPLVPYSPDKAVDDVLAAERANNCIAITVPAKDPATWEPLHNGERVECCIEKRKKVQKQYLAWANMGRNKAKHYKVAINIGKERDGSVTPSKRKFSMSNNTINMDAARVVLPKYATADDIVPAHLRKKKKTGSPSSDRKKSASKESPPNGNRQSETSRKATHPSATAETAKAKNPLEETDDEEDEETQPKAAKKKSSAKKAKAQPEDGVTLEFDSTEMFKAVALAQQLEDAAEDGEDDDELTEAA